MANAQAVLVYETNSPIAFTIADATAVEKGDFLALTDPMTVVLSNADNDIFGGIAAEEKIANDGKTKIAVYRQGIFKVECGAACTVGKDASMHAKNEIKDYTTLDGEIGYKFGKSLETGADGEFIMFELGA